MVDSGMSERKCTLCTEGIPDHDSATVSSISSPQRDTLYNTNDRVRRRCWFLLFYRSPNMNTRSLAWEEMGGLRAGDNRLGSCTRDDVRVGAQGLVPGDEVT